MKFFNRILQCQLNRDAVRRAADFAKKISPTINYQDSNQTNLSKIQDDHFVSKLGEEACKIILEKFAVIKGPDYNIYSKKNKSWDADLFVNNIPLAVKTQRRTNAKKYSLSWTFQSNAFRKDTILNMPEAWVIFVEYNDENPYECCVYPPYQINELIFKEPKLAHLKAHKKVVYAHDLIA